MSNLLTLPTSYLLAQRTIADRGRLEAEVNALHRNWLTRREPVRYTIRVLTPFRIGFPYARGAVNGRMVAVGEELPGFTREAVRLLGDKVEIVD